MGNRVLVAGIVIASGVILVAIGGALWTAISSGELKGGDWLQFSGTLIGAAATIVAGGLALWSIQKQIKSSEAIARDKENSANEVIKEELRPFIETTTICAIACEKALKDPRYEIVFAAEETLKRLCFDIHKTRFRAIHALFQNINAMSQNRLSGINGLLNYTENYFSSISPEYRKRDNNIDDRISMIEAIMDFIGSVEENLKEFDVHLFDIINSRHTDIDSRVRESDEFKYVLGMLRDAEDEANIHSAASPSPNSGSGAA